ncbi:MAG: czcD2 [Rhodospirillales bacterium]|nr:czcD2 [Rhodospirillales bacterium]
MSGTDRDLGHHHAHDHGSPAANQFRVLLTFWLIAIFMVVEAVGGWWAGSLTLMADAGHMLTDSGALALAWFASRAMRRPSDSDRSYGHDRFSVLAALINGLSLLAIVAWIGVEAIQRLIAPEEVKAIPMLVIAVVGFLVNSAAFFMLHGADRDDMNIHAALLHVLGDILASAAAIAAATIIILKPQWTAADPVLSVVAGALILRNAVSLVRRSWHVLMEATPEGVNVAEIASALETLEGVADIHHLHAWALVPGKTLITLHAQVAIGYEPDTVLARIKWALAERFHIDHSTIQMEGACADDEDHRDHSVRAHAHSHGHGHSHRQKLAATR